MKYGSFNPDVLIGGDGITNDAVWLERLQKFVNIRWDDSPNPNPRPRRGGFWYLPFGVGYLIARTGGFGAGRGFQCLMLRRRFGVEGF